jgi:hypothetical protein
MVPRIMWIPGSTPGLGIARTHFLAHYRHRIGDEYIWHGKNQQNQKWMVQANMRDYSGNPGRKTQK